MYVIATVVVVNLVVTVLILFRTIDVGRAIVALAKGLSRSPWR